MRKSTARQAAAHVGFCATVAVALCGCVSVLPTDVAPMQRFRITAPEAPAPDAESVGWQLLVEAPTAPRALDTSRIALTRSAHMYEYLAGAEWSDRAPGLVQSLLVQGFENSGKIVGVSRRAVGVRGDLALTTDLRRFEVDYDGGRPTARVSLYLKLVRQPLGTISAAKLVEAEARADRNTPGAIANAFDRAAKSAIADAVVWTLEVGGDAATARDDGQRKRARPASDAEEGV